MTSNTKLDEKLEGVDNFRAWKYRVMLIIEENDLEGFIEEEVAEPEGNAAKEKYKKNLVKAKRIIADSIKDHLILHVFNPTSQGCLKSKNNCLWAEAARIVVYMHNG
jgi:hypothetical protein